MIDMKHVTQEERLDYLVEAIDPLKRASYTTEGTYVLVETDTN